MGFVLFGVRSFVSTAAPTAAGCAAAIAAAAGFNEIGKKIKSFIKKRKLKND